MLAPRGRRSCKAGSCCSQQYDNPAPRNVRRRAGFPVQCAFSPVWRGRPRASRWLTSTSRTSRAARRPVRLLVLGGVDDTIAPPEDGGWCARDHRGSAACGEASASRCCACRSRRRSSGVVPPQIPVGSPVRSAHARQSAATGHRAQIALAAATCPTAGPDSLTGKNSSGSMPGSPHAARSVQEVLTGRPRDRTAPRARGR